MLCHEWDYKNVHTQNFIFGLGFTEVNITAPVGSQLTGAARIELYGGAYRNPTRPSPHSTHPNEWNRSRTDNHLPSYLLHLQPYPDGTPAVTISTTHPIKVSSLIFTSLNISLTPENAFLPLNSPSLSLSSVCASRICCCCCWPCPSS